MHEERDQVSVIKRSAADGVSRRLRHPPLPVPHECLYSPSEGSAHCQCQFVNVVRRAKGKIPRKGAHLKDGRIAWPLRLVWRLYEMRTKTSAKGASGDAQRPHCRAQTCFIDQVTMLSLLLSTRPQIPGAILPIPVFFFSLHFFFSPFLSRWSDVVARFGIDLMTI